MWAFDSTIVLEQYAPVNLWTIKDLNVTTLIWIDVHLSFSGGEPKMQIQ